jgi:2-keto-4-pentenoate hydratase/2-oxohepta-3-ene-1,7-dioic acid hydratase in catechol pathway
MRLVTFSPRTNTAEFRTGILGQTNKIIDVVEAAKFLGVVDTGNFRTMMSILENSDETLAVLHRAASKEDEIAEAAKRTRGQGKVLAYEQQEAKLRTPIPRPYKIFSVGGNYESHMKEHGRSIPDMIVGHWKMPSTVIGTDEDIIKPPFVNALGYELEMAFVIGKRGIYIPESKAMEYVAGYTVFNDLTASEMMKRENRGFFAMGKNLETFSPTGPYLVTPDEVGDPYNLMMELRVNGEVRQHESTKGMIFSIPKMITYFSSLMSIEPGDVVTTGTIAGTPGAHKPDPAAWFLKPGDLMEAEIEKLGILRNRVVAGPDARPMFFTSNP